MTDQWWAKHWITPLSFLPFATLLYIHWRLGMSDAMMVRPRPGQPHSIIFNIALILSFWAGVAGYLAHTFVMLRYGLAWVIAKCVCAGIAWILLLVMLIRAS